MGREREGGMDGFDESMDIKAGRSVRCLERQIRRFSPLEPGYLSAAKYTS